MGEVCGTCGKEGDLRPYGPNGSLICYGCANKTPEAREAAGKVFMERLTQAEAKDRDGVAAIGTKEGPRPYRRGLKKV